MYPGRSVERYRLSWGLIARKFEIEPVKTSPKSCKLGTDFEALLGTHDSLQNLPDLRLGATAMLGRTQLERAKRFFWQIPNSDDGHLASSVVS